MPDWACSTNWLPPATPLTQKASRNCSWAIILGRLLCQMLALLPQAGLNMGQESGAPPGPVHGWPRPSSLPFPAGAVCKLRRQPQARDNCRREGKRLNLFCLGLESAAK